MKIYKIKIGNTYYKAGYFNTGKEASLELEYKSEKVLLYFNKKKIDIDSKINRTSNKNGTVRIYGGNKFKKFIQDNYKLNEDLEFEIISKTEINFVKKYKL